MQAIKVEKFVAYVASRKDDPEGRLIVLLQINDTKQPPLELSSQKARDVVAAIQLCLGHIQEEATRN